MLRKKETRLFIIFSLFVAIVLSIVIILSNNNNPSQECFERLCFGMDVEQADRLLIDYGFRFITCDFGVTQCFKYENVQDNQIIIITFQRPVGMVYKEIRSDVRRGIIHRFLSKVVRFYYQGTSD